MKLSTQQTGLYLLTTVTLAMLAHTTGPLRGDTPETQPSTPTSQPQTQSPASSPAGPLSATDRKRIEILQDYYTKLYSAPLENSNWFVRAMAVTLLSRLETPDITARLVKVLKTDPNPLAKLYAWEALHARNPYLTDEQRTTWIEQGLRLHKRNVFRGDLQLGLLRAATPLGPDGLNGQVGRYYLDLLSEVRHTNPYDSRTIQQMRTTLQAWKDPDIVQRVIGQMTRPNVGYVAEFVLGGLNDSIEPLGRVGRPVSTGQWSKARAEWTRWLGQANLQPTPVDQLPPYRGLSKYLPHAKPITDPDDPAWKEDLELGKLNITHFDLVFCLDMTGSMKPMIEWVARDAKRILAALKVLSRSPRIGVVYYCHEVIEEAMAPCCKEAAAKAKRSGNWDSMLKMFPLTPNTARLAQQMSQFDQTGGHKPKGKRFVGWGAIYSGLWAALNKQPWSRAAGAQKIIVCFGDSILTENTEAMTEKLVAKAGKEGFVISFIEIYKKRRKDLAIYGKLAKLANGGWFELQISKDEGDEPKTPPTLFDGQIAAPPEKASIFSSVIGQVISSIVPPDYRPRTKPFVAVLMEYIDAGLAGK